MPTMLIHWPPTGEVRTIDSSRLSFWRGYDWKPLDQNADGAVDTPGGAAIIPTPDPTGATDAAAVLQSAINSAITGGLPVVIPPGLYRCDTPLSVSAPVVIRGAGAGRTTLRARDGLNDYVIKFSGGAPGTGIVGAQITDLDIDCNAGGQTSGSASGGILAAGAVQCHFERLHIYSAVESCMSITGITGGAFGHHNRLYGCLFDNAGQVGAKGPGRGLTISSSDETFVIACDFEYLGGTGGTRPACILDLAGLQMIEVCNFVGAAGAGQNIAGVQIQDANRTRVVGCTFDGVGGDSVLIVGTKNVVSSNMFTSIADQAAAPNVGSGIHLGYGAKANAILGNTLESSATAGRTRSLIREENVGGSGLNSITGNTYSLQAACGTANVEAAAGIGSVYTGNVGP